MVVRSKRGARPWAVWDWAFAKIGAKRLFRKAAQPGGRWQLDINRLRVKRLRMAVLKVNLKDGHGREVVRTTAETAVLSTRTSQRLQTVASTRWATKAKGRASLRAKAGARARARIRTSRDGKAEFATTRKRDELKKRKCRNQADG
jgi:hypothetical protein